MAINFRTIHSCSAGNCVAVWTENTRLLIDCGLSSMKRTRAMLGEVFDDLSDIDACLVSHVHSDHISHYPLRVLEQFSVPVLAYYGCVDSLRKKHFRAYGFGSLALSGFRAERFEVGDLEIEPFEVPHHPQIPTFGFVVRQYVGDKCLKVVLATDFNNPRTIARQLVDADMVYVESNHDLELLRRYYNPNSVYHMPNPRTADLLAMVRKHSRKPPQTVMLGHLSEQRNKPAIAIREIRDTFKDRGQQQDFELLAAPPRTASQTVTVQI